LRKLIANIYDMGENCAWRIKKGTLTFVNDNDQCHE